MRYSLEFKYQGDLFFPDTKVFHCHILFKKHTQIVEVRFKILSHQTINPHDEYEMHVETRDMKTKEGYYDIAATRNIQQQVYNIFAPTKTKFNDHSCAYHLDLYDSDKQSVLSCAEALFKAFSINQADREEIRKFINTGIPTERQVQEQVKALYLKNDLTGAIQVNHDFMAKNYQDQMCNLGNQFVQNNQPQDAYNCYMLVAKNSPRFEEAQVNIARLIANGKCKMIRNTPNEKSATVIYESFFSPSINSHVAPKRPMKQLLSVLKIS